MVLWIAMAALAAAVCLPMLMVLRRRGAAATEHAAVDIYRDQLDELGREVERGLIRADEAEAARTEIARRLLKADAAARTRSVGVGATLRNAAVVAVLVMPIAAVVAYSRLGSPDLPDQSLAARLALPPEKQDLAIQILQIDRYLAQRPDDGRAWQAVAPAYVQVGRFDDAVTAYGNVIRLLGSTAERQINLGRVLVVARERVTDEAVAAFRKATVLAPADLDAHVYLASALESQGKPRDAAAVLRELLATAPAGAEWVPDAKAQVARLEGLASVPSGGSPAVRGPSAEDVAAAQDLPPEQRAAMIEGMVATLATRLETDAGNAEGWAQLVRSYAMLGRPGDARAALAKARAALAADKDKTALVEQAARSAGIEP